MALLAISCSNWLRSSNSVFSLLQFGELCLILWLFSSKIRKWCSYLEIVIHSRASIIWSPQNLYPVQITVGRYFKQYFLNEIKIFLIELMNKLILKSTNEWIKCYTFFFTLFLELIYPLHLFIPIYLGQTQLKYFALQWKVIFRIKVIHILTSCILWFK